MARVNESLHTFNRGRISRLALARTDLERTRLSAEVQTNWVPRTLGSMMLRPGMEFITPSRDNQKARYTPFVFSSTDTALVEVTPSNVRVIVDDAVVTRVGSTAVITGGTFTSTSLAGWTDADESGSTSEFVTGNFMGLTGSRFSSAIRRQTVVASSGDHALAIDVERGRPTLRVGSSAGGDDYIEETALRPGGYSLKFTSTGSFHVQLSANTAYTSLVDSVAVESSGDMLIPAPWNSTDLDNLRFEQSGDIIYTAAADAQQRRIVRFATESWAVDLYDPEDGPFRTINTSNKQINPTALTGNISLEANAPVFQSGDVGSLVKVTSVGQQVNVTVTDDDQFSDSIRVSGVDESRIFDILVSVHGSTLNTIRVQRSVGSSESFSSVSGLAFTSTTATTHNDGLDNQIAFYRIGSVSGDIGSTTNSIEASLTYASGGITGIARVTGVSDSTESTAIVLRAFGSTAASELFSEGSWSTRRGFPTSLALHEGRLSFAGKSRFWLSQSDAFEVFDEDIEGDSAPINRSVGKGPVDFIPWLMSLTRLIIGTQGAEKQAKTSSLEEPLTPTNFSLRNIATQGSANIQAVEIDETLFFVQRGGTRVFEVRVSQNLDFESFDRTIIVPEIGEPAIVRMAAQRQPDTRLHCTRSDGTVAMLITDPAENVLAWLDIETGDSDGVNGVIEEVAVLPGAIEDDVYYLVKRVIMGGTVRYLEKWAKESEARGGATNKMADSFLVQNSTATTLITGADHLTGQTVIAWGNGKDLGTYTVSSTGEFTISEASTTTVYGLGYSSVYKSAKLAYAASAGTPLTQRKRVDHIGLILADVHAQGLRYGRSTDVLDQLPRLEKSAVVSTDTVSAAFDNDSIEFPGEWTTDERIVLVGQAPRPVTVLGAVISIQTKDKI